MNTRKKHLRPVGTVSTSAVMAATGLTFRQVDHWCRSGLARPLPRTAAEGAGVDRWFPVLEVQRLVVMARLVAAGFRPAVAAGLADEACAESSPYGASTVVAGQGVCVQVAVPVVSLAEGADEVLVGW